MTDPNTDDEKKEEIPICEECDRSMNPFAFENISGWACDGCGWSFDDEEV